jgi:hypothetical protein
MSLVKLIAIHNFTGAAEGDLPFAKGEILYGIELVGEWWNGKNSKDQTGSFPANYVKKAGSEDHATPGMQPAPPGPHRSNPTSGSNYGNLPGGPTPNGATKRLSLPASPVKTRLGTVIVIRGIQVLTSLFALSFMGSTATGKQYMYNRGESVQALAPAAASLTPSAYAAMVSNLPSNDGVKLVLAMSILGWLESSVFLILACLGANNLFGLRDKLDPIKSMSRLPLVTFGIDCFLGWLTLIGLTLCPTESLTADRRAVAGAVFLMMYLMVLVVSILMSYKDMTKQKLIRQGWVPPSTTNAFNAATDPTGVVVDSQVE